MSDQSTEIHTLPPALSGNDDRTFSARGQTADAADDEPDYHWAEYNLPRALLDGIAPVDDEDRLAFVCFGIDSGMAAPEGLQ